MTDLTPNDLSHLSDAEFHALCPQGEHAPGHEPLSPAAQAIVAAFNDRYELHWEKNWREACLASALRALADAVVMKESAPVLMRGPDLERQCQRQHTRKQILSIATELENHD